MSKLTATEIAEIAYEANRAYARETMGDTSFGPWADAPDWQKETCIKGVLFHHANPDASPEASHESWLEEKRNTGWVYGETKDPEARTHPCIVPYAELPVAQRAKDHLFVAIVKTALAFE